MRVHAVFSSYLFFPCNKTRFDCHPAKRQDANEYEMERKRRCIGSIQETNRAKVVRGKKNADIYESVEELLINSLRATMFYSDVSETVKKDCVKREKWRFVNYT